MILWLTWLRILRPFKVTSYRSNIKQHARLTMNYCVKCKNTTSKIVRITSLFTFSIDKYSYFICMFFHSTTTLRTVQVWRDDSLCLSYVNGSDSSDPRTTSSSDKLRHRKSYGWQVGLIIFLWKSFILFLRSTKKCARLMTNLFRKRLGWVRQTPMESSLLLFVSTPMTWKLSLSHLHRILENLTRLPTNDLWAW